MRILAYNFDYSKQKERSESSVGKRTGQEMDENRFMFRAGQTVSCGHTNPHLFRGPHEHLPYCHQVKAWVCQGVTEPQ
jgi:hypothetical protein